MVEKRQSDASSKETGRASNAKDKDIEIVAEAVHTDARGETNYEVMKWWHLTLLLLAETVSLGILSLSWAIARLGVIPGTLSIVAMGLLSTYTGKIYGDFKNRYPEVLDIVAAGELLFGRAGYWLFEIGSNLVLIFIMAAHVIGFAIMMKASPAILGHDVAGHANKSQELLPENNQTCGVLWLLVGTIVQLLLTLPRKMKSASYISSLSSISVLVAVIIVMVDTGKSFRQDHSRVLELVGDAGYTTTIVAVLCIVTSYTGHVAYLSLASELKEHKDFKKALYVQMTAATCLYTFVGFMIYYFVGATVPSPALSAASKTSKMAAYGVASFTIVIAGVVNAHVLCKHYYHKFFEDIMKKKDARSWCAWIGLVVVAWVLAFILAGLIPSFHLMLALVSALFSAWFTFGVPAWMWFHLRGVQLSRERWRTLFNRRPVALAVLAAAIFIFSCVLSLMGLYATINDIVKIKAARPFSCNVAAAQEE